MCVYIYILTYIHTYTYTYLHTHIYIHTYIQVLGPFSSHGRSVVVYILNATPLVCRMCSLENVFSIENKYIYIYIYIYI
jgi:hypothetical protein